MVQTESSHHMCAVNVVLGALLTSKSRVIKLKSEMTGAWKERLNVTNQGTEGGKVLQGCIGVVIA